MNTALMMPLVTRTGLLDYLKDPELLINTLLNNFGGWMIAFVALIVFIESGVLFPVLPGDSMIFTLGILHSRIPVPIWVTVPLLVAAAVAGNGVGYWLGAKFGPRFFKPDARVLKTEHLDKAQAFFDKYGGRSLVLARFVPFVRTFVPLAAGMARYPKGPFLLWNLVGALVWAGGLTILGLLLGDIPLIRNNIEVIAIVIVVVSVLPMFVEIFLQSRKARAANIAAGKESAERVIAELKSEDNESETRPR